MEVPIYFDANPVGLTIDVKLVPRRLNGFVFKADLNQRSVF